MKKLFVAPQLLIIPLCREDVLTLSATASGDGMILDLEDLFNTNN